MSSINCYSNLSIFGVSKGNIVDSSSKLNKTIPISSAIFFKFDKYSIRVDANRRIDLSHRLTAIFRIYIIHEFNLVAVRYNIFPCGSRFSENSNIGVMSGSKLLERDSVKDDVSFLLEHLKGITKTGFRYSHIYLIARRHIEITFTIHFFFKDIGVDSRLIGTLFQSLVQI